MKTILAFGDSNTWGLIPGSNPYRRYDKNIRWTGILEEILDNACVVEEGLCGRTTVFEDKTRAGRNGAKTLRALFTLKTGVDAVILMLGTNDCKADYKASPKVIGEGLEECLNELEKHVPAENILLVSPIHLGGNVSEKDTEFDDESVKVSKALRQVYSEIAKRRGHVFLAASDYVDPSPVDDEHLDGTGHQIFAEVVADKLIEAGLIYEHTIFEKRAI